MSSPAANPAAALPGFREGDFVIKDFAFDSGERLPELKLRYTLLGLPLGETKQVAMVMHGTVGSGKQFQAVPYVEHLFGPGKPLDATKWSVILPDSIGMGGSSKPSDGLRGKFPRYGYADMVRAQHRLLTEHLKVNHLRLVMGTSMGGMQTWLWGVTHPKFMDALAPIACQPDRLSGRNLLWRRLLIAAIRNDPAFADGMYAASPSGFAAAFPFFQMLIDGVGRLQRDVPDIAAADAWIAKTAAPCKDGTIDANNILRRFESSFDYDPAAQLEKIEAPLLSLTFEDDELNPVELGAVADAMKKLKRGESVVFPAGKAAQGHTAQNVPAQWGPRLGEFLAQLG